MRRLIPPGAALLIAASLAAPAIAYVNPGDPAPDFTKNELAGPPWAAGPIRSLSSYPGKVIVFFLLGATCPTCLADGPSVEADINQYYQQNHPGQVQVVGVDLWDRSAPECGNFKTQTGATYPILLNGNGAGGNFTALYGPWDNYVVVSKQGIVRYHADIAWDHNDRYHPDEIRGCVDSLVSSTVDVEPGPASALALASAPNPFSTATTVELAQAVAGRIARVTVHDLAGRRVATLHDGPVGAGVTRLDWDGRADGAGTVAPGVYLLVAEVGGERIARRVVRVR